MRAADREEATESRVERQRRGKESEGKEALGKFIWVHPHTRAIPMPVKRKELRERQFVRVMKSRVSIRPKLTEKRQRYFGNCAKWDCVASISMSCWEHAA